MMSLFGLIMGFIPADKIGALEAQLWTPPAEELQRVQAAYQSGLGSALQENFSTWITFISSALIGFMPRTVGVMMIGMALFKWGFLSGKAPTWLYATMLAIGAVAIGLIGWQAWLNVRANFDFVHMQSRGVLTNAALSIFGSIGYASLFVLLVKTGARFVTAPLAAVGRMAFTNYIAQSLIMTTIFWGGRGFGLFGEVDRPSLWLVVLAVWALQLLWSPLWLKTFRMGPLEWVWRRLSYGRAVVLTR
jgi:uncharacterized protein